MSKKNLQILIDALEQSEWTYNDYDREIKKLAKQISRRQ